MDTTPATTGADSATATTDTSAAPSGTETTKDSGVTVDRSAANTSAPLASGPAATEVEADWSSAATEPETGVALEGEYPVNHRLRAERMFDAGLAEDPDKIITPELIADAGARITAERAHADTANPAVSAGMKVAELERIAGLQGIDLTTAANNDDRVRIITEARAAGIARPANEEAR